MRPDDPRLHKQRKASLQAKTLFKKGLSIFPGYPIRQEAGRILWQPVSSEGIGWRKPRWIGREELREAQVAWSTLHRHFPEAIHEAIENVEAWKSAFPPVLEILKGVIHHGKELPAHLFRLEMGFPASVVQKAERMARQAPGLAPLLGPLSWICCLEPERAKAILSWLYRHREALQYGLANLNQMLKEEGREEEAVLVWVRLALLIPQVGNNRLQSLVSLLGHRKVLTIATLGMADFLEKWRKILTKALSSTVEICAEDFQPPKAIFPREMFLFLKELFKNPPGVQRRVLELMSVVLPKDILPWARWWQEVHDLLAEVRKLCVPEGDENLLLYLSSTRRDLRGHLNRLTDLALQMPGEFSFVMSPEAREDLTRLTLEEWQKKHNIPGFQEVLFALASPERKKFYHLALPWLSALPSPSLRMSCLWRFRWFFFASYPEKRVLSVFRELQRGLPSEKLPALVKELNQLKDVFDDEIQNWRAACEALKEWLGPLEQTADLHVPIWVSQATDNKQRRQAILLELATSGENLSEISGELLQIAAQMIDQPEQLLPILKALRSRWDKTDFDKDIFQALVSFFRPTGWWPILREGILQGEIAIFEDLRVLFRLGELLQIPPAVPVYPERASTPEWAKRYPHEVQPDLALLAAVSPRSEQTAKKILKEDFPLAEELHQEIIALEKLVQSQPVRTDLARRLKKLQAQLHQSLRKVSPQRLEHLRIKLRRAIRRELFRQFQDRLQTKVSEALQRILGVSSLPDWVLEPRHSEALLGILKLKNQQKWAYELGLQLLRRRCGPPPWRPWDTQPNQEFLDQLRQRGVNPEPWVRPAGPVEMVGDNGRRVWLSLEQDPLEIFQMGAHFNTCLSPWRGNFFAAIVDAADANKQVLYARDQDGKVVGRCLLAISTDYALLAYYPYCHDGELNFQKLVEQFVAQLAKQMNIPTASQGVVALLLAKAWYCDHPMGLPETPLPWAEDPSFRERLGSLPLSEVAGLVENLLEGRGLDETRLCQFLQLAEAVQRPELVLVLLPRIRRPGSLSLETYHQILDLLQEVPLQEKTKFHKEGLLFVRKDLLPMMIRWHRWGYQRPVELLAEKLASIDPWSVLRLIRATRPEGVRWDRDERDPARRKLLAKAFAAAGRNDLAQSFADSQDQHAASAD